MFALRLLLLAVVILPGCSEPSTSTPTPVPTPAPPAAMPAPAPVASRAGEVPLDVSVFQLVVTPERFDGKRVRVMGYLHLDFEDNGLYPHQDDYEQSIRRNGLWVQLADCSKGDELSLSDAYVLLEGRFSSQDNGHLGMWSGALLEVSRCDLWPRRRAR